MRKRVTNHGLTARAIAGSHVVLLSMNMDKSDCNGLRGFGIHRTDHTENEAYWLQGMKTFKETDPGLAPGAKFSTRNQPIQDFSWADYSAKPGHDYTYKVLALKGPPNKLEPFAEVSVRVKTESPECGDHDVYFNRGAAASQEYARRFGNRVPGSKGGEDDPAWAWLSRGAHEAILEFIGQAKKGWGLRVGAYEFRLPSVLNALHEAHARGADVRILYDAGHDFPRDENRAQADKANIKSLCDERVPKPQALSHNKFIVLLKGKKAVEVLTGSTNFSDGGVFGQSNVVHVVEEPKVAEAYLAYWEQLQGNPERKVLAPDLTVTHPLPEETPPKGTMTIFSPRESLDALDYYGRLAAGANDALFMTFAFGMHDVFKAVYRTGKAGLRYALFETLLGPGVRKEKRAEALKEMIDLRRMPENRFAVGSKIEMNQFDNWVAEKLTGLNQHVKYIHTKYMLIDPLGNDPIIVTGSANFSAASTNKNDENMLIIRGNKRAADVYLGEFMRLWDHYAFREWAQKKRAREIALVKAGKKKPGPEPWYLDSTDAWWKRFFANTDLSRHREYFAG
ncbi:MAG TPA: phospholipase D-like domain-containing protein [Blastocatellia bacterium]|nr:phospholipase D-like domain-containing protein [Blastocatellia bacterium]